MTQEPIALFVGTEFKKNSHAKVSIDVGVFWELEPRQIRHPRRDLPVSTPQATTNGFQLRSCPFSTAPADPFMRKLQAANAANIPPPNAWV
ncbi:MAG: hypothetical protein U5K37_05270 [Natrialbaceae archaeon]|nr:hypothetical protein [Natrialbaceae archaeon]